MCYYKKNILILLLLFLLLSNAAGCIPLEYKTHPEFETRSKKIKAPGLIPPDIKVYEFTAGGVQELRDDWCVQGKSNILSELIEGFEKKEIQANILFIDEDTKEEMEGILALYRAVSESIGLHVYGPYVFPEKKSNFDYSIGSIEKILKEYNADAIIIVYGRDEQSTDGRNSLKVAGIVASAFIGAYVGPRFDITSVSIAVVEPSGTILCYCKKKLVGGYSFVDTDSVSRFLEDIISNFPRLGLE